MPVMSSSVSKQGTAAGPNEDPEVPIPPKKDPPKQEAGAGPDEDLEQDRVEGEQDSVKYRNKPGMR